MKFLKLVLLTLLNVSAVYANDPPSTHGMLLFGKTKTYLSHLPMFHAPHDYQWVMEVKLPPSVFRLYALEGPGLYTIVPERFVLPEVAKNKTPFMATLFKGHFEKGGKPITQPFQVKIVHNLVFKKFDPSAVGPDHFSGFIVGAKGEKFLIHEVTKAPDFDQVLEIKHSEHGLKFVTEGSAFPINTNSIGALSPHSTIFINPGTRTAEAVELLNEIYLEKDELE